jgi:hypothetical protein
MHIEPLSPRVLRAAGSRRGGIAAVAALVCTALISACGSSTSSTSSTPAKTDLNTKRVALSIEQSILSERHIHAKVSCPAVVPQQQGKSFVCIATTFKGKTPTGTTPFAVTVQNNKGYVTYQAK